MAAGDERDFVALVNALCEVDELSMHATGSEDARSLFEELCRRYGRRRVLAEQERLFRQSRAVHRALADSPRQYLPVFPIPPGNGEEFPFDLRMALLRAWPTGVVLAEEACSDDHRRQLREVRAHNEKWWLVVSAGGDMRVLAWASEQPAREYLFRTG